MILSHRHRFIFIKTNKTAGTSVEIALSRFCGPEDVITPLSEKDEKLRASLGYPGPQNYKADDEDKTGFYNHMSAVEIKQLIKPDVWESYFKFCIERNPWDRLISMYYWRCRREPRPSISEFLESDLPILLKTRGIDLYRIDNEIVVDKICRYEDLAEELEGVRVKVGIPEPLELPRAKSNSRKDTRSYREILSEQEKMKIASLFAEEIETHGYQF